MTLAARPASPVGESQDLATRARAVLAGGSTHVARSYSPAIQVDRSQGARKWLVDGRELVDYTMGHGALILGHAHPAVVAAVQRQVESGTHFGAGHRIEVEWAERIASLVPSAERVRFTNSGTEAIMLAIRVARATTGRDPIVKVDDHFHGWYDAVSVNLDREGIRVATAGVPRSATEHTRIVRAGDVEALAPALQGAAAMVIEASGAHYGHSVLDPAYVHAARLACSAAGALLIMDEVVTGFRVAPGGLQAAIGVTPDLTAFAKIMAGGLPGGAVGGQAKAMSLFDNQGSGRPAIAHPGTFNANPLTGAAGLATLDLVAGGEPLRHAEDYAIELEGGWRRLLESTGVGGRIWRFSSIVHSALATPQAQAAFAAEAREQGVDLFHTSAFCSSAHGERELADTLGALERALHRVSA